MHRARVVPGWQYYRSGRYRSFLFLCFQSIMSSPGKHAVTQSNVCPGENHPGQFQGTGVVSMDPQDSGPDCAAVVKCNHHLVHLLNNLWCILIKTVDCISDRGVLTHRESVR